MSTCLGETLTQLSFVTPAKLTPQPAKGSFMVRMRGSHNIFLQVYATAGSVPNTVLVCLVLKILAAAGRKAWTRYR